jgi:hypothetical protein
LTDHISIRWVDSGREPRIASNPNFPDGIDLDVSNGAERTCMRNLSYPARRCGYFLIECRKCGQSAAITTAGRRDDPRSIKLACLDD